jgi:hypothetical protein
VYTYETVDTAGDRIEVSIFADGARIGGYTRNYGMMHATFHPFEKAGRWYALYSHDYTATSVMSLPTCTPVASEVPDGAGFCPVDYFVPSGNGFAGQFAFVFGCVWACPYEIRLLDLRDIERGRIANVSCDGHDLPDGMSLAEAWQPREGMVGDDFLSFAFASAPREHTFCFRDLTT